MTNKRFFIDCNGIIDNWKTTNKGNCEDRLSWSELCDTLNQLDKLADENLDEYRLIVELESELQHVKTKTGWSWCICSENEKRIGGYGSDNRCLISYMVCF